MIVPNLLTQTCEHLRRGLDAGGVMIVVVGNDQKVELVSSIDWNTHDRFPWILRDLADRLVAERLMPKPPPDETKRAGCDAGP